MIDYTGKQFVVTGGAGFIGSHIVDALIEKGAQVTIIDNLIRGKKENINPKAAFIQGDVADKFPYGYLKQTECIFHLAASGFYDSFINVQQAIKSNITGTNNVLEYARTAGCKVVNISSGAVNDNPHPYGLTKKAAEDLCDFYKRHFDMPITTLRYYNVYGPRQVCSQNIGVIPIFVEQCLNGQPFTIHGDGMQRRIFTYITDVVDATLKAYESDKIGVYPVASNEDYTISKIAEWVFHAVNPAHDNGRKYLPHKLGDIDRVSVDIKPTMEALNWRPTVRLPQGIQTYVDWRKQSLLEVAQ